MTSGVDIPPSAYDLWRRSPLGALTECLEHDLIISMSAPLKGMRVLDVGCGDGTLTNKLATLGADAVGVDANSDMIAVAQTHQGGTYQVATATALPFPDASFDRVIAMTVLCVAPKRYDIMAEISRVLRPGGRLVIGDLGRWSTWALMRRLRALLGNRLWRQSQFFTKRDLTTLISTAGLEPVEFKSAIYYPPTGVVAGLLSKIDPTLARALGSFGAAFIALSAQKP